MKKIFAVAAVVTLILTCCGCKALNITKISHVDTAMGTVIQLNIYTTDRENNAEEDMMKLLRQLEEQDLSRRLETSEVWRVNQAAKEEAQIMLSPKLAEILSACLEVWEASQGAFDITVGSVAEVWNIDQWAAGENKGEFVLPETEKLWQALEQSGSEKIQLKDRKLLVQPGMVLDLGAVGKGIALDELLEYLQSKQNITGAIISVGGSVLTYGEKPEGNKWIVGITNPKDTASNIGTLSLEGQWCISTSGDYERYVEIDGVRYHHILNPNTGYPANSGLSGVTVLTKDGFLSDALSTACFVLGEEKGLELAAKYSAEVLFIRQDGSVCMSPGMKDYYRAEKMR